MSRNIPVAYLSFVLAACSSSAPPPAQPAPPLITAVSDVASARAAVHEGRALAVRPGPVGVVAVRGDTPPTPLGRLAEAPARLSALLSDTALERLVLMPGDSWSEADLQALCAAARGATRPDLPCEHGPPGLLEAPDSEPVAEVLSRQLHASATIDLAAAAAVADRAIPAWLDCYRTARQSAPGAGGRIVLEVAVGAGGAVRDAAVTTSWGQEALDRCVADAASTLVFSGVDEGTLIAIPIMLTQR